MKDYNKKIVALVVTYNRKNLLQECLTAILNQSYPVDKVVVIDNNSTDGTNLLFMDSQYSIDKVVYRKLSSNIGGAGGFNEGIKYIETNFNYDLLWLMDDDTIALKDTVKGVLEDWEVLPKNTSFIASSVYGPLGEPMNVPEISKNVHQNGYPDWYRFMKYGLVEIEGATFVSLFINSKAIKAVGLPIKEYFIWGDDVEYTLRLTNNYGPAYFSSKSEVVHKRFNVKSLSIKTEENKDRIAMFSYLYRNRLLTISKYNNKKSAVLKQQLSDIKQIIEIMFSKGVKFKSKKIKIILKGIYQYHFKSSQLK